MNKKFAFTLSEVLITMGVIGIIAAITVPTLVKNYQNKAFVVQLRSILNDIETATDLATTEEGKTSFLKTTAFNNITAFPANYLRTVKSCSTSSSCFNSTYGTVSGATATTWNCSTTSYILANGAAICMIRGAVYVDTNGKKGPNIGGRDMFYLPMDSDGAFSPSSSSSNCTTSYIGKGCYEKLIENGWEMDY